MLCCDARQDDNKSSGRSCNLDSAAAEYRYHQPGNDRRVDALLRLCSRSDSEGHGQRQRNDANNHARQDVTRPLVAPEQTGLFRLQ